jgi:hypothetical protein
MNVICICQCLLLGLLTVCPFLPQAAWAQIMTRGITGKVTDPSGAPVAGASVLATDLDRGTYWPAQTDAEGIYVIPALPIGYYEVLVVARHFDRAVTPSVRLNENQTTRVDVQLKDLCLPAATPTPTPFVSARGKPPYSITISTDQNVVKAGSEIKLHIVETNISRGPLHHRYNAWPTETDYKIYVHDNLGALAPQTEWGTYVVSGKQSPCKIIFKMCSPCSPLHLGDGDELPRGEKLIAGDVLLKELYELSPGQYTVQVQKEEDFARLVRNPTADPQVKYIVKRKPGVFLIKSNTIAITVTP